MLHAFHDFRQYFHILFDVHIVFQGIRTSSSEFLELNISYEKAALYCHLIGKFR